MLHQYLMEMTFVVNLCAAVKDQMKHKQSERLRLVVIWVCWKVSPSRRFQEVLLRFVLVLVGHVGRSTWLFLCFVFFFFGGVWVGDES